MTLQSEEPRQRLSRDYDTDKKWILEGSKGLGQVGRAITMSRTHAELAARFSALADKLVHDDGAS